MVLGFCLDQLKSYAYHHLTSGYGVVASLIPWHEYVEYVILKQCKNRNGYMHDQEQCGGVLKHTSLYFIVSLRNI